MSVLAATTPSTNTTTSQRHKVFLQKRSVSGDRKMPVAVPVTTSSRTNVVVCSLCPEQFPGAKELGLHILTVHCGGQNNGLGDDCEDVVEEEVEDNLVIEGSPGESMEVEQEPLARVALLTRRIRQRDRRAAAL